MLEMVGNDDKIRTLSRYFQPIDEINAAEADRGATATTQTRKQQVVVLVERFVEEPGVSGRLIKEARGLLNEINQQ